MNPPVIRALIPFYEGERYVERCLASLYASETAVTEVVVVDNGPTALDVATLPRSATTSLRVIRTKPRIGFGRACNIGLVDARDRGTDVVILCNQDGWVFPDAIGKLSRALEANPDALAAAPLSLSYDGTSLTSRFIEAYVASQSAYVNDLILATPKDSYSVAWDSVNAACVAVAVGHLRGFELFDPLIFMYGEEQELFQRYQRQGRIILLVPGARFAHVHTNSGSARSRPARLSNLIHYGANVREITCSQRSWLTWAVRLVLRNVRLVVEALIRLDPRRIGRTLPADARTLLRLRRIISHRRLETLERDVKAAIASDLGEHRPAPAYTGPPKS